MKKWQWYLKFFSSIEFFDCLSCILLLLMLSMNANLFSVSNLSIRFQRRLTKDSCSCSRAFSNSTFSLLSWKSMNEIKSHNDLVVSQQLFLSYTMTNDSRQALALIKLLKHLGNSQYLLSLILITSFYDKLSEW